jgi:hypothetical protein
MRVLKTKAVQKNFTLKFLMKKKLYFPNRAPSGKFCRRRGKTLRVSIPAALSNNMMTSPNSNGISRLSCSSAEALFLNQFRDALNPEIEGDIFEISTSD